MSSTDEWFRLTAEVRRVQPWWPVSTRVSSEWTFFAPVWKQGENTLTLPLLTVRAEPPVDLGNRSPAGKVTAPLTVTRQDGQAVASSVELEFSTDDGATWQRAAVSRDDGTRWRADVTNPAGGFVSLRMKATDIEGNNVSTTVVRAYQT